MWTLSNFRQVRLRLQELERIKLKGKLSFYSLFCKFIEYVYFALCFYIFFAPIMFSLSFQGSPIPDEAMLMDHSDFVRYGLFLYLNK